MEIDKDVDFTSKDYKAKIDQLNKEEE